MIEIGTLETSLNTLITESPYFVGAEGDVGDNGIPGPQGPRGPRGADGPLSENDVARTAFLDLCQHPPVIDIDTTHALYSSKSGPLPTTQQRLSSGTFRNRNGQLVGRTNSSTSINLSTLSVGTQLTISIPSGSTVDWQIGSAIALLSDTDDDNTIDVGESHVHGTILNYDGVSSLTLVVTSWGGSTTISSWSVAYRGPRFQYSNIKKQSRNLLLNSETFNSIWTSPNNDGPAQFGSNPVTSSLVNAIFAPNYTFTATKVTEISSVTPGYTILRQNYRFNPNQTYTFSVYAKYGNPPVNVGDPDLRIRYVALHAFYDSTANGGEMAATFDLQTGTVGNATRGVSLTRSIESIGDGWYRCSITFTTATSAPWSLLDIRFHDVDAVNTQITTRSNRHAYIWGAMLEVGSGVSQYEPTGSNIQYFRQCEGILLEESHTNMLNYSSRFLNNYWTKNGLTITENSTISPDGTQDADLLTETATTSHHNFLRNGIVVSPGETLTFSVFVKGHSFERNNIILTCDNNVGNGFLANFDITKGEVASTTINGAGTLEKAIIEEYLNGWYRCSITGKISNVDTNCRVSLNLAPNSSSSWYAQYAGATSAAVYAWGAQLEISARPSSLVETTASSGIRAADTTIYSGSTLTNLWPRNEGTILCEFTPTGRSDYNSTYGTDSFVFQAGTDSQNYIACYCDGLGSVVAEIKTNGVTQYISSPRKNIDLTPQRIAISFKNGQPTRAVVSGTEFVSATNINATLPAVTAITIGSSLDSTNQLNGTLGVFRLYNSYFSLNTLTFLTSRYFGILRDQDATAYSDAVNTILQQKEETLQDVISEEQRDAINRWVVSGKRDGWYDKIKHFYLPIWGDAEANAINLIDRSSGTFFGTLTHSPGMCRGDGSTGYFNYNASLPNEGCTTGRGCLFFLLPNTSQTLASMSTQATLMGSSNGGGTNATYIRRSNSSLVYSYGSNSESTFTYFSGMHLIRKNIDTGCTYQLYRSILEDSIQGSTSTSTGLTTTPITVWASNTAGTIGNYSTFNIGCHGFGLDMTEVQASLFIRETTALWKSCTGLSL